MTRGKIIQKLANYRIIQNAEQRKLFFNILRYDIVVVPRYQSRADRISRENGPHRRRCERSLVNGKCATLELVKSDCENAKIVKEPREKNPGLGAFYTTRIAKSQTFKLISRKIVFYEIRPYVHCSIYLLKHLTQQQYIISIYVLIFNFHHR